MVAIGPIIDNTHLLKPTGALDHYKKYNHLIEETASRSRAQISKKSLIYAKRPETTYVQLNSW